MHKNPQSDYNLIQQKYIDVDYQLQKHENTDKL